VKVKAPARSDEAAAVVVEPLGSVSLEGDVTEDREATAGHGQGGARVVGGYVLGARLRAHLSRRSGAGLRARELERKKGQALPSGRPTAAPARLATSLCSPYWPVPLGPLESTVSPSHAFTPLRPAAASRPCAPRPKLLRPQISSTSSSSQSQKPQVHDENYGRPRVRSPDDWLGVPALLDCAPAADSFRRASHIAAVRSFRAGRGQLPRVAFFPQSY
jgi:hypothetical protein